MCIYEKPEDSYQAFYKIWSTWYKKFPNQEMAKRYSGNDRAHYWLTNVTAFYQEYNAI